MDITFLFYTHSDYADLWEVLKDTTSKLIPTKYRRLVAVNANSSTQPAGFDDILTYDDSLNYSDKVLSLMNQISTEYVAFIHDNDLMMSFSDKIFVELLSTIKTHNMDRCMFGVIGRNNGSIQSPHFNLVNTNNTKSSHFTIPYDVSPSIWRTQAFKDALSVVPNTSYRDIEESAIQTYCKEKLNVYGFASDEHKRAYYTIGRPFSEPFQFLHMFVRGKCYEPYVYMEQAENFKHIVTNYPAIANRGLHQDSYPVFYFLCKRTV